MTPSSSVSDAVPARPAAAASSPSDPEPVADGGFDGAAEAVDAAAAEAAAWAEVLAGWDDEASHRAYLARFHDLDGLATAGARYRAVLVQRPGDAIAARFRDEVLRRAVAHGLATLPRARPDLPRARLVVRVAAGAVIFGLLFAAGLMAARLVPFLAGGARP